MRAVLWILLAGVLPAGAIEGTVWYDAGGKVAWVDGPAAEEKAPVPFVPQWVAREERRDRALRGDYRPRGRGTFAWTGWGYGHGCAYPVSCRRWSSHVSCRSYPSASFHHTRPSAGVRVIIR